MITSLARQSVVLKCNLQKSAMLGNYEMYYAAGLMAKFTNTQIEEGIQPMELWKKVVELGKNYETEDKKVLHLIHMLDNYIVHEEYDAQMWDMFQMGFQEKNLWMVNI